MLSKYPSNKFNRIIIIDECKYQQVFLNLLSNAIKYTYKGSIEITISATNELLTTTISDTGIGIKDDTLRTLSTLFDGAEEKISSCKTGFGLGIVISKKLVEIMGGELVISKNNETGTCVKFTSKITNIQEILVNSENKNEKLNKTLAMAFGASPNKKSVLIVDDTVFNVFALKKMLNSIKITTIIEAFNGEQAVNLFKRYINDIGLIFMDINMPFMNGFEASSLINSMLSTHDLPRVPIIAISAQSDDEYLKKAPQCGIYKYRILLSSV